jgi:transcriptional regulator with XRE-family HTH domain
MRMRELVGRNIERLRIDRGLTQEALADKAKLDQAHVARIERANINVTVDVLEKLTKALRVPAGDLFEPIVSAVSVR